MAVIAVATSAELIVGGCGNRDRDLPGMADLALMRA
jgi:hypothetical protein